MRLIRRCFCLSALSVVLLTVACSQPTTPESTGAIRGRLVDGLGRLVPQGTVGILGTNLIATADSSGRFVLYGMPAGTVELRTGYGLTYPSLLRPSDTVVVIGGQTVDVGDVRHCQFEDYASIVMPRGNTPNYEYLLANLTIFDAKTKQSWPQWYLRDFSTPVMTSADSLFFEFSLNGQPYYELFHSVRFLHNHDVVYDSLPGKLRVRTPVLHLRGRDTFEIRADTFLVRRIVMIDSAYVDSLSVKYLNLTVGKPVIAKAVGYLQGSNFFITGTDTLRVIYPASTPIDWDLVLVNDATNESCSWNNRTPNWGSRDSSSDDPRFWGDEDTLKVDSLTGVTYRVYTPDRITSVNLADGTYSVFVRYFEGPADSVRATPVLNVELGSSLIVNEYPYGPLSDIRIMSFRQASPATPLAKGEVWYAGKIRVPVMTYEPAGVASE